RLFDFKQAPDIDQLGFNAETQKMLMKASTTPNGLTLVSGVFGSGKGTTLNAVGKKMEERGNLAVASLDDPIEYLRKYNQYEYSNHQQLQELIDAFKKMDLNAVFLNEVITPEVAEAVFNLVSSGVHVLTTIHTNRVYRIMYKLEELLKTKYLSLIPFINVISYQDKFSVCCDKCVRGVAIEKYKVGSDEEKLMKFLDLTIIKQPSGCEDCDEGIVRTGIKVVSEHIEFNDKVKTDLLKLNIHEQFDYLKELTSRGENLEDVVKEALVNGEILIDEALSKLDTWR
ncbi:ATPase, T2SS/T4P/T4SS family, partial [Lysinibacillus xylanilyticus]|uniref:ATPase, T2SS/T4P/T4SS family n=1 Tax=Lysinibacillus xylanilyticus TaxID=582475 RepID=UPI0036DBA594